MNGIHDLGGMAGFGPIEVEPEEPTFHDVWECSAFRLNLASIAILGAYNADEYRHAIERMSPPHYLQATYYERVLTGVASLLVEKSILSLEELERRAGGRFPLALPVTPNRPDGRGAPVSPHFFLGNRVRVRDIQPPGHTRVPRYVRGRVGVVVHVAPAFNFPDASAHGLPRRWESTYHVEFSAKDLWDGSDSDSDSVSDSVEFEAEDSIVVDLWESYLEEAR